MHELWTALGVVEHELLVFAAVGFVLGGLDDLLLDVAWLGVALVRRATFYRRHRPATVDTLNAQSLRLAVFVPAWQEADVIAPMLRYALAQWPANGYRIFVGTYPNDASTRALVASVADARVVEVVNERAGPTTKAACLNSMWQALRDQPNQFDAIVLHDAEDIIDRHELRLFAALLCRFDFIQLPVLPLVDRKSRWIGGVYIDEFAEHHGKTLPFREAVGAGLPAAGVGCAFRTSVLAEIAVARGGQPFDADSLTEDYELGLRLKAAGKRGAFVRIRNADGELVAVRAHFPGTVETAARQKARWIAGIALHGWDRLRWHGGLVERWMRWRDRRPPLAALVLLAGYLGFALTLVLRGIGPLLGLVPPAPPPWLTTLLLLTALLLLWRLAFRFAFVTRAYGWREGLMALPRVLVANFIAILAARRAVSRYLEARRAGRVQWDKTAHQFPEDFEQP